MPGLHHVAKVTGSQDVYLQELILKHELKHRQGRTFQLAVIRTLDNQCASVSYQDLVIPLKSTIIPEPSKQYILYLCRVKDKGLPDKEKHLQLPDGSIMILSKCPLQGDK
jgi:hypothetical protein